MHIAVQNIDINDQSLLKPVTLSQASHAYPPAVGVCHCILLVLFFFIILLVSVQSAPKSSLKKRLAEYEAVKSDPIDAASATASSSSAAPRGSRQRLNQQESLTGPLTEPITARPLTDSLKRDWAAGHLTARKVQQYALDALKQGAHSLGDIAATGAHGKAPQHIHRSLLKIFGTPKGAPEFDWVNIPGKNGFICQPFLMPHKFFACLYEHNRDVFYRHLRGPVGSAREYWEHLASSKFVQRHPLLADIDNTFPIGLHGDAGASTKHDSLMVISWNGLLGRDNGRVKSIVFAFVRKRDYTPQTLDRIWELFAWSVNRMAVGRHPVLDWDRNPIVGAIESPLAGPYSAVLSQIRGDWQFYVEIFAFPPWNGAVRMCWMCRASGSNPDMAFTDCRDNANWRSTRFSDESFRAYMAALGLSLPVLLLLIIGLRLECISIDSLHALDLGFSAHVAGNTFWETVTRHCWGKPTQEANVAELEKDLKIWSKKNKINSRIQGQLHKERIRATSESGHPKLKAKGGPGLAS